MLEILLFTLFALVLGTLVWWVWQQREMALRQAETTAQMTELGHGMRALAHDLHQSLELIVSTTQRARMITPGGLPEVLSSLENAARSAADLVGTIDGPSSDKTVSSAEGVVHLGVILLRSTGVPIDLRIDGRLHYAGSESEALRVVQNLLANAVRETAAIAGGRVSVAIGDGQLRIGNPVRNPALLDESIWRDGVSHTGSDGLGLSAAREAAARVGWSVRHEVGDRDVTFVVVEQPPPEAGSNGGPVTAL